MFDRYSLVDMFGPFYGENWFPAEIADGITFRWTGPEATSSLRVPMLGAQELRVRWTLCILPQEHQLSELAWTVDGERVAFRWAVRSGYATLWADVQMKSCEPSVVVSITVPARRRGPNDDPGDTRSLGIAVHKVEVFALNAEAVGEQAHHLQRELQDVQNQLYNREQEIAAIKESTSWKVSGPLRWLKRGFSAPEDAHTPREIADD